MSVSGKGRRSLRKSDIPSSKNKALGTKRLQFAHQATAGVRDIDLTNLNNPVGFIADSTQALASARLKLFEKNLSLYKDKDLLIPGISYLVITSTKIRLTFDPLQDELFFGNIEPGSGNRLRGVDAKGIFATDILEAGKTDINVGEFFKINANPNSQIGELLVFINGIQQFRNENNATAAPGAEGEFQELEAGSSGEGSVLRMNESTTFDRPYLLYSTALILDRPSDSTFEQLERVFGILDKTTTVLSEVAGEVGPEADGIKTSLFAGGTSNLLLKQFGDLVNQIANAKVFAEENTFSAIISNNGATAAIVSQNSTFIQSVSRITTGRIKITFIPGFFTTTPAVTIGTDKDNFSTTLNESEPTSNISIELITRGNTTGTASDAQVHFSVQRQGADYKPAVAIKDI